MDGLTGNESSKERILLRTKFKGMNIPGPFCSRKQKFQGKKGKGRGSKSSRNRIGQGPIGLGVKRLTAVNHEF